MPMEDPTPVPPLQTKKLQHEGVVRTYHLHLPAGFDPNRNHPLVLALHGGGGQGLTFDEHTNHTLSAAADKYNCILAFPEGMDKRWNDGRSEIYRNLLKPRPSYDDVGFLTVLIDTLCADYPIDPQRLYVTGISNGGFMSIRLAMELSHRIAAIAPVTAQLTRALEGQTPKLPISVMIVNGTKDPLVPYDGGTIRLGTRGRSRGDVLSTAATIEFFRRHNQCQGLLGVMDLPRSNPDDGTHATLSIYPNGLDGTEVRLIKVVGGGHGWPGGQQYLAKRFIGKVSQAFDASDVIFDFFMHHTRP